jgi:excisionase family DNA binding protein
MQYLTPDEAAVILRVSPKSVYRWLNSKTLKGRKFGKVWRIPVGEVAAKVEAK